MKELSWYKGTIPNFDDVPKEAGIYVISTQQEIDDEYEVKYIGQSNDLQARAKKHWSANEENKDLKNHIAKGFDMKFSYASVSLGSDRDGMEGYLYITYDPPYNDISPPRETVIECSLPKVRKHN
jgi:excinuclease UvrABC nuclease subunit